jgi:hypothetical protein
MGNYGMSALGVERILSKASLTPSQTAPESNFAIVYDDLVEVTRSEMSLPSASTRRPTFADISPGRRFRALFAASSVTATPITPSVTVVALHRSTKVELLSARCKQGARPASNRRAHESMRTIVQ